MRGGNCDGRGKRDGQARPRNGSGPGFAAPESRPAAVFS
jgi:hypothetical protein